MSMKKEAIERAQKALARTEGWSYAETPWNDARDGHIIANGGGRSGKVIALVTQSEDGEALIEVRDALAALVESVS